VASRVAGIEIISEVQGARRRVDMAALINTGERPVIEVKHRPLRPDHRDEDRVKILTGALDEVLATVKNRLYTSFPVAAQKNHRLGSGCLRKRSG
jgi:hypothetical protein